MNFTVSYEDVDSVLSQQHIELRLLSFRGIEAKPNSLVCVRSETKSGRDEQ